MLEPQIKHGLNNIRIKLLKLDIELYEKAGLYQIDKKYDNFVVSYNVNSNDIIIKMIDIANMVKLNNTIIENYIVDSYYKLLRIYHNLDLEIINYSISDLLLIYLERFYNIELNSEFRKILNSEIEFKHLIDNIQNKHTYTDLKVSHNSGGGDDCHNKEFVKFYRFIKS
jgi:hypothetical protein